MKLTGSIVALITPFDNAGKVNFDKLGELIEWHIENGTDGILVLGTTGEAVTMSHDENVAVVKYAVERVAGRVPVIAGSGSNSTSTMLEKSLEYQGLGVDALLLISPYYNKANPRACTVTSRQWPTGSAYPAYFTTCRDAPAAPYPNRSSRG